MSLPTHIALLGLMGVGKTTVGRVLAEQLCRPLNDSDISIQQRFGATVRELGQRLGIEGMHRLEAEHLLGALAAGEPSIVGVAASVVEREDCRRALAAPEVFAVWLDGGVETLVRRFAGGPHRPVLDEDTERLFRRQVIERSRLLATVADCRIAVEGRTPAVIAQAILAALASTTLRVPRQRNAQSSPKGST